MKKFFSLIFQGDVHLAEDQKVIPAKEFSTLVSAEEILAKAREDAARQKKESDEEAIRKFKDAEERGFAKGLEEFNEHIFSFDRQVKALRVEMQQMILPIALRAAKKIVSEQLKLHPETIVGIVLQAIGPVAQNHKIKIYVNKADKEILEENKQRIKDIFEHLEMLMILERPDIAPGGCIIETESGIINATIENQWRALEAAFERYMKST